MTNIISLASVKRKSLTTGSESVYGQGLSCLDTLQAGDQVTGSESLA